MWSGAAASMNKERPFGVTTPPRASPPDAPALPTGASAPLAPTEKLLTLSLSVSEPNTNGPAGDATTLNVDPPVANGLPGTSVSDPSAPIAYPRTPCWVGALDAV